MNNSCKPMNVLIVGMPRSGTSMTASIFSHNQYFIADDKDNELRSGDEYNPSGYWEAKPLIQSNAEIFAKAGFKHNNTWLFDAIKPEQASAISQLSPSNKHKQLVDNFNQNSPWMWKDPRLCYTLGYWWPLLNHETTRVLLLKRDENEIYQSFLRLKWRTATAENKADVHKRIKDHLAAAEQAIKQHNIPYIEINYADYKNKPEETAAELSAFFNINIGPQDLGYNHKLNNQSIHGKISRLASGISELLPVKLRKFIIRLIPGFILKILQPHRFTK